MTAPTDWQPDWQPRQMPTLLINHYGRLLTRQADERLKTIGLTASQLPVLAALKDGSALTQRELAEAAGVEQPSMAQLLARMELGDSIPQELYRTLAEIIAFAWQLKGKFPADFDPNPQPQERDVTPR